MSQKKNFNAAESRQGVVVRNTGSSYIVRTTEGEEVPCRVKGNFRIRGIRTTNPVAVGDIVTVKKSADDADYITAVEPRRNYIIRRASNLSKESHILASNLDRAALVIALRDPLTPTTFIDRFLATAEAYNVPAMIIINKIDIYDEDEMELADAMTYLYTSIGYEVRLVSAHTGAGIEELREEMRGKTTLLAGNSGVGKSSLINALVPGANLRTGEISDIHHTGTHTTTFSEMVALPGGGDIIDIPGVKGFGTIDFEPSEVSHYFPEIFEIGRECRYSDCKHTGEPGCAVVPAVEDHRIAESRYASYLSILDELAEESKYRKPF
ncbi:MAG: ribosome small subunit-dependent GTPase A [Muribaculaceae bacterium]|nr:ribosome small subunit-dependent GTPase A [Muribaculaceae bacterium]